MPRIRAIALLLLLMAVVGPARAGWDEGVAAFRNGDLARAVAEFSAVVNAQPDFAGGHFMLAQTLSSQGSRAEALSYFRRAYELDAGNVVYQFALAKAYLANGRAAEAVQMLERIDPSALPSSQRAEYQGLLQQARANAGFD
ncbi:tetratricopeptide repeat protein [Wenzhouxiangella marina]|nr:tetratricopeptide repeat protein [Wenzhouxiangella marina]MBB6087393.1 putative Zn-dependent protease [Wenzhouxiangella marina]